MGSADDFESAWDRLDEPFRVCLDLAWQSLCSRGLPVGAVITRGGEIVARGRNRVYDPPGGVDRLQGTPIAHAEMNAFAALRTGVEIAACELWTTHTPCAMCLATAEFTDIATLHWLASDPSDPGAHPSISQNRVDDIWGVVANVLFLHNVAWVGGEDNRIIERTEEAEPETVVLSQSLVAERSLIGAAESGAALEETLIAAWDHLATAASRRRERLGDTHPTDSVRTVRHEPGVRFVYAPATHVEAIRRFYGGLVGLHEVYHSAEEGTVSYDCSGLQFTFLEDRSAVTTSGWATQPGWNGDTSPGISWSVELTETGFRDAVARLQASPQVERLHDVPRWVGYWSFPVRDPMGNTVELSWPEPRGSVPSRWGDSGPVGQAESG